MLVKEFIELLKDVNPESRFIFCNDNGNDFTLRFVEPTNLDKNGDFINYDSKDIVEIITVIGIQPLNDIQKS